MALDLQGLARRSDPLPITGESEKTFHPKCGSVDCLVLIMGSEPDLLSTSRDYTMVEFEHPMRRSTTGMDSPAVAISCKTPGCSPQSYSILNHRRCLQFIRWMLQC